jgi:hypothetical protein
VQAPTNTKRIQHPLILIQNVPRDVSTTDEWALRSKSFVEGCQVAVPFPHAASSTDCCNSCVPERSHIFLLQLLPFTACCPASFPYQALTRVVVGDDHVFAALFEGQGGAHAARHCATTCYEMLTKCLQTTSDPCCALRQTTQLMDRSYMNSDLPDIVSVHRVQGARVFVAGSAAAHQPPHGH